MGLAKPLITVALLFLVAASFTGFGLSVHNIIKLNEVKKILAGPPDNGDDIQPPDFEVPGEPPGDDDFEVPGEPPGYDFIPQHPITTTNFVSIQRNGDRASHQVPGLTDQVSFQGWITARIPVDENLIPDEDETTLRVRLATEMWLCEDGERFATQPGPVYELTTPIWPTAAGEQPRDMMAKAEFAKPFIFDRPVKNLAIGVTVVSVTNIDGEDIGYTNPDTNTPRADIIINVQW